MEDRERIQEVKVLLNSKSEFNRCEIPHLMAGTDMTILKEFQEDEREKRILKLKMKEIR